MQNRTWLFLCSSSVSTIKVYSVCIERILLTFFVRFRCVFWLSQAGRGALNKCRARKRNKKNSSAKQLCIFIVTCYTSQSRPNWRTRMLCVCVRASVVYMCGCTSYTRLIAGTAVDTDLRFNFSDARIHKHAQEKHREREKPLSSHSTRVASVRANDDLNWSWFVK